MNGLAFCLVHSFSRRDRGALALSMSYAYAATVILISILGMEDSQCILYAHLMDPWPATDGL